MTTKKANTRRAITAQKINRLEFENNLMKSRSEFLRNELIEAYRIIGTYQERRTA